jgi:hypothetical protein
MVARTTDNGLLEQRRCGPNDMENVSQQGRFEKQ